MKLAHINVSKSSRINVKEKGKKKKKQTQKSYETSYEFLNTAIQEIDLNAKTIIRYMNVKTNKKIDDTDKKIDDTDKKIDDMQNLSMHLIKDFKPIEY